MKNSSLLFLLSLLVLAFPHTVFALPSSPDLDVTHIERTPRYFRYCVDYPNNLPRICPGTETQKHWPAISETVTYRAHVMNKGTTFSGNSTYTWIVNGVSVKSGNLSVNLGTNSEQTFEYQTTWPSQNQVIQFTIDSTNNTPEVTKVNNSLTIGSHDLTLSYWVEEDLYNRFNATPNALGSYSFEDWVKTHIDKLNEHLEKGKYNFPLAASGAVDRLRIDKIVVAPNIDGSSSPMNNDPEFNLIDGRWRTTDNDPTNANGQNGFNQNYVNQFATQIDWGLIHEVAHQLGAPDLYHMRLPQAPANNGIQIVDINGELVQKEKLPNNGDSSPYNDLMGGGDIRPYSDHTYFSSHTIAGLNTNAGKRRGYFAEYYFDTPLNTNLKLFDNANSPIANAQISLHQRDPQTELFSNTPVIVGTTDSNGVVALPNRAISASITTATGHTLRPNPFGNINVVGTNGTMIMKVTKDNKEGYGFFLLPDLNVAYWKGQQTTATVDIQTTYPITFKASPTPTAKPGDVDQNGQVNLQDLSTLLSNFGKSIASGTILGDITGDRLVSLPDLSLLLSNFGK